MTTQPVQTDDLHKSAVESYAIVVLSFERRAAEAQDMARQYAEYAQGILAQAGEFRAHLTALELEWGVSATKSIDHVLPIMKG